MALHDTLYRRFIGKRAEIVETVGNGEFKLPPITEEMEQIYTERMVKFTFAIGRQKKKDSAWGWLRSTSSYEKEAFDMYVQGAIRLHKEQQRKG